MSERVVSMDKSVIANGASVGSGVRIGGAALIGLVLDSAWDTQIITFQTSVDTTNGTDGNWVNIYLDDAATELQVPAVAAAASRALAMNTVLEKLAAFTWIRPRSGTSGAAVAQGGATTITFVSKS